ncbi:retrovirus-related pol polyprotein from transposon TNT 1-94 [Tanacetum coccineum]
MSTSKTYQQSLADAGSENRPPMLERGPYEFKNFVPEGSTIPRLQTAEDLEGDDLLLHDAEMEVMNMILLSIPNEIYNSVDACTSAKDMWKRVERLMRGTIQNKVDRETRFTNEFDQFVAEPGEALVSVYNRFAQLMNDLERNNMNFPTVTINTKFLNSLQPEWLKYVTQVRLAKQLTVDSFDDLFDYLQQFEKLVNASRAKKLEKSHDPLALVAHTGSSSRQTSSYYVTHPTSVVDYDDEYQQDDVHNNSEDPLVSAMLLLAKAITQNFSNPTNNRLRASSNTRNQAIIQGDRVNIQSRNSGNTGRNGRRAYVQEEVVEGMNAPKETGNVQRTLRTLSSGNTSTVQCYNCSEKGHYARNCPKPRVRDSKYFMEQMLLAKQDEAGVILTDEQNDFLFADASRMEEIEELSANICLMAVSRQMFLLRMDWGQVVSMHFISEGNVNSGSVEKDTHVPDLCAVEKLARNAYQEAKKQRIFAQQVQTQNTHLTSFKLTMYKERVRILENINKDNNYLNEFLEADERLKTRLEKVEKGVNATSRVRRPMSKDSSVTNSVLVNSKKAAKNVSIYVRKNKQKDNTFANVISDKENVIAIDVANDSKAKTLLCVSCMQNVLIPCHDKCIAKHKLNVRSNVRRTFSTNSRTPKSLETTYVAPKTRFSKKETQSKTLVTTSIVSKSKIDVESASKIKDKVVQIVLWVVDSGCSKHMTVDRSLLRNFIEKFMGTFRFGNDNFAAITGYGDYIHGNITICHVYYVEGLGHNLFSVGQFCDGDLEVAFRSNTCYVRNLEGDDLLTGGRDSNLYTISISDMAASSPVCLMSKATSTKSWLWHRRLSHLNFGTINDLTRLDLVDGLPKFKYGKDHLCSACERGKSKKASHPPKLVLSDYSKLELLHMDLCGPMRVASINGKKYILVTMDDFTRYTWVYFLRSKDETPEIIKKFITQAQLNYKAKVCKIRTDNGTEFKNATLKAHYEKLGIMQQFSIARTPQQNGIVDASFHVFGSLCYPTNDRDDLGKMKPKADIGVFIGYSETSRGFQIYNQRTKKIMETIHVKFDELTTMASEHDCLEPELQRFNNHNSLEETMNTPSKEDLDNLFGPMFEEYFEQKSSETPIYSAAQPTQVNEDSPSTSSIIIDTHEAPPVITTFDEQTSLISLTESNEFNQEDSADFDGNA